MSPLICSEALEVKGFSGHEHDGQIFMFTV